MYLTKQRKGQYTSKKVICLRWLIRGAGETQISWKKIVGWINRETEGEWENSGHIHFRDGLRKICGDLGEAFPSAVYNIVATGTGSRAVQNTARGSHEWLVT